MFNFLYKVSPRHNFIIKSTFYSMLPSVYHSLQNELDNYTSVEVIWNGFFFSKLKSGKGPSYYNSDMIKKD